MIAGTLNFWAPRSNQNIRIIRSIHSINDTMEQLHFIITKITKNFSQLCDCAMNNTLKIPYFLACWKICRTYINKLRRENTQNRRIIHHKVIVLNEESIASILHKSALSKFLSEKRDVNFSTRNLFDVHF